MADIRGSMRAMGERLLPSTPTTMLEEIVPSSDWTEDCNGHYLLVDLPDFKKEEVRLEVNISAGHITISGERQVNEKKTEYFKQKFTLPPNSDVDKITGKFDGEILYVTVPKVATAVEEKRKEPEIKYENVQGSAAAVTEPPQIGKNEIVEGLRRKNEGEQGSNKVDGIKYGEIRKLLGGGNRHIFFSAEDIRKWEEEGGNIIKTAMEMLNKNKGIVLTAVVAFSLGMLEPICYMNSAGEISIMGSREVNETTSEHFVENFTLPPNSDASKYTVKFVNEILYVTVPKVEPKNEDIRNLPGENGHVFFSAEKRKREEEGGNIRRTAMEMLNKDKGIVMTAVVALSLVMLVYRKFQSAGD
ncbi:unnamed protein product [Malus baccata var. baccata]